jgi:RNA polymerase sigma factor (sigma-70 family)
MNAGQRREVHQAMVRFSDGDRDAFRAVFDGLWPALLSFARGMGLSEPDAEDAAQKALLRVFDQIADLDPGRDGVAWALTLTAYEVLTIRKQRSRRREAAGEALAAIRDERADPEALTLQVELHRRVHEAVGALEERDRAALALVLADAEPSLGETARKRRYRAIERLRAWWGRAHGQPG